MSIDAILGIASSGLDAQSQRITLLAQNLANADSINSPTGEPYQRRVPVFAPAPVGEDATAGTGVQVAAVLTDNAPPLQSFDPSSPFADAAGMVKEPTINPVYEMVDMMQASRSYQANLSVIQTANTVTSKTLDLLK
ncbi:MAG: flagellar basal body rod protein FlgC [Candidatus Binataceae bacterium]